MYNQQVKTVHGDLQFQNYYNTYKIYVNLTGNLYEMLKKTNWSTLFKSASAIQKLKFKIIFFSY